MYCRKCQYDLPDTTEVCPVCGTPTRRHARKQNLSLKRLVIFLDAITMASGLVHILLWATASHYVTDASRGLLLARQYQYQLYPDLATVDLIFAVLFLAIPIFSALMRYQLMRMRCKGRIFLVITLAATILWGILYPLLINAVTGMRSPLVWLVLIQSTVYAGLAIVPTIILLKSDKIIY